MVEREMKSKVMKGMIVSTVECEGAGLKVICSSPAGSAQRERLIRRNGRA